MHPGREHDDELTVFESLGIAVEDLASAELVVRRARERGIGAEVDF
jgi:ornithine cyclodeaminase/alanine dehydrogenase-like protein (mu-crystallin family)